MQLPYKWFRNWSIKQGFATEASIPITTEMLAAEIGVTRMTLYRWIKSGRLKSPPIVPEVGYPLWFKRDVERARKLVGKLKAGRPKKKSKKKGTNKWQRKPL